MSLVPAAAPDHVITWCPINEDSGKELVYELKMEVCVCVCPPCVCMCAYVLTVLLYYRTCHRCSHPTMTHAQ